jgi:folate-dependent tRNA-U54 methylase TrmFO/GidA
VHVRSRPAARAAGFLSGNEAHAAKEASGVVAGGNAPEILEPTIAALAMGSGGGEIVAIVADVNRSGRQNDHPRAVELVDKRVDPPDV